MCTGRERRYANASGNVPRIPAQTRVTRPLTAPRVRETGSRRRDDNRPRRRRVRRPRATHDAYAVCRSLVKRTWTHEPSVNTGDRVRLIRNTFSCAIRRIIYYSICGAQNENANKRKPGQESDSSRRYPGPIAVSEFSVYCVQRRYMFEGTKWTVRFFVNLSIFFIILRNNYSVDSYL